MKKFFILGPTSDQMQTIESKIKNSIHAVIPALDQNGDRVVQYNAYEADMYHTLWRWGESGPEANSETFRGFGVIFVDCSFKNIDKTNSFPYAICITSEDVQQQIGVES